MSENIPIHLIAKYLAKEATDAEQEELLEWVSGGTRNQKIFREYSQAWENKKYLSADIDVDHGLTTLNSRIDEYENESGKIASIPWMKIAASLLLLVIFSGGFFYLTGSLSSSPGADFNTIVATDEITSVTLQDGSTVKLNRHSTLRYPKDFQPDLREVFLRGEAFFSVEKDHSRPFIVRTGEIMTEVLGTSFNIRSQAEDLVVTVSTGKVKVSDGFITDVLFPSDQIIYSLPEKSVVRVKADLRKVVAWTTNTIIFDDMDLPGALKKLEEHFGIRFHFENESIEKCLITGTFRDETLPNILDAIAFSTEISYVIRNKEVWLSGKGCR